MPIVDDEELRDLLATGRITAITLDTNIFVQKGYQLNSAPLKTLASLKEPPFRFLLSSTVEREVLAHLEKAAEEALGSAKKGIGQALFSFETETLGQDNIIQQITGGKTAKEAANQRWNKYVEDTGCKILDDTKLVKISTIYDGYFASEVPFGTGRKKNEFPDALALHALEKTAEIRGGGILVVSDDGDWSSFCEQSDRLYLLKKIEHALGLITDTPIGLLEAIYDWLAQEGEGRGQVQHGLSDALEDLEFFPNVRSNNGRLEIEGTGWANALNNIDWSYVSSLDIIEVDKLDGEKALSVIVSLPLILNINVSVELSLSYWGSEIFKTFNHSENMEEDIHDDTILTLNVHNFGTGDQKIEFDKVEIQNTSHDIDCGEVKVSELKN